MMLRPLAALLFVGDMLVSVTVTLFVAFLFLAPGRLDLASNVGRQAAPTSRPAVPTFTAAAAVLGRAPTGCIGAPTSAAGASDSSSLPEPPAVVFVVHKPGASDPQRPLRLTDVPQTVFRLIDAIGWVESRNDDSAVGDGGRARGRYQITLAYWIDGGRSAERYAADVLDPAICRAVMIRYWKRYCPAALFSGDLETLARVHAGGPRGAQTRATERYWLKVETKCLTNLRQQDDANRQALSSRK